MCPPAFSNVQVVSDCIELPQIVLDQKNPYVLELDNYATLFNMINIPKCRCGSYKKVTWTKGKMYIASACKGCKAWNKKKAKNTKNYRMYKKDYCEECGFIAQNKCQLDVDHVDGNAENNAISNLRTLCSNCHRLKTHTNRDYVSTAANEHLLGSDLVLFDLEYLFAND